MTLESQWDNSADFIEQIHLTHHHPLPDNRILMRQQCRFYRKIKTYLSFHCPGSRTSARHSLHLQQTVPLLAYLSSSASVFAQTRGSCDPGLFWGWRTWCGSTPACSAEQRVNGLQAVCSPTGALPQCDTTSDLLTKQAFLDHSFSMSMHSHFLMQYLRMFLFIQCTHARAHTHTQTTKRYWLIHWY